jgi:dTMP kinase
MGLFVTLEGPDGAGKSTQLELLRSAAAGRDWVFTRNPGGTSFGQKLRSILLDDRSVELSELAELFLYMADRAQHITELVKPALAENKVVICDRFIDSTVAYQGNGRGLNIDLIKQLNKVAIAGLKPDLTFLFDVDPAVGLSRAKDHNKMEEAGAALQSKVRAGFLQLAAEEPERFVVIDAVKNNIQEVHQIVMHSLEDKIQA